MTTRLVSLPVFIGLLALVLLTSTFLIAWMARNAPVEDETPDYASAAEPVCSHLDCDEPVHGKVGGFPFCWDHYLLHESARIDTATLWWTRGGDAS